MPAVRVAHGLPGEKVIGEINGRTDWRAALTGMDAVVHLAARVHVMRDAAADPLAAYRAVNVGQIITTTTTPPA
ncbi:MAG: hypothetical protein WA112_12880 [Rugosibacter sp.]|nr:hypothetical protein [Rugosibacter sp.]